MSRKCEIKISKLNFNTVNILWHKPNYVYIDGCIFYSKNLYNYLINILIHK